MEKRASIEEKWQERWEKARLFEANRDPSKPKFFIIFAYPGVSGYLHVGHMRGYTYTDAISRYKRMRGFNVLFPVGTHATGNISINFAKKVQRKDQNWLDYLAENGCPSEQIEGLADPDEVVRYFSSVYVDQYWKKFGNMYQTGDSARRDEDGYIWVIGRLDDVIKVSGYRLGTAEVESALVSHPAVAEAAAIGLPHELKGNAIHSYVILVEGVTPNEDLMEELRDHVGHEMGPIAKPETITSVESLPKTRSGKIMRRLLKARALGLPEGDISTLEK